MSPGILVVNPGSTSTKLAFFRGLDEAAAEEIAWSLPSGLRSGKMAEETDRYAAAVEGFLNEKQLVPDAVVGRGGFINRTHCRLPAGVYEVVRMEHGKPRLCEDIHRGVTEYPEHDHASNYGIPVAARIALERGIPAFCADPVVVDELDDLARVSGYAGIERRSLGHMLSVRAMCRKAAEALGREMSSCRMVALHLGGGMTVAAVKNGRIADCNNALLGGGPFSPQRAGSLPLGDVIDLCYSGRFTRGDLRREMVKNAGLRSYLGDDDMVRIGGRIAAGDSRAALAAGAMVYQIAKEAGAMAVAAGLPLDAIVCSGGLARSGFVIAGLRERLEHLAPFFVYPGSLEMTAMAHGAWRVLNGLEQTVPYHLPTQTRSAP